MSNDIARLFHSLDIQLTGSQGFDSELSGRQGRVDSAAGSGSRLQNGDQEEPHGVRQEADGPHGPGRGNLLSRRTPRQNHPNLLPE